MREREHIHKRPTCIEWGESLLENPHVSEYVNWLFDFYWDEVDERGTIGRGVRESVRRNEMGERKWTDNPFIERPRKREE